MDIIKNKLTNNKKEPSYIIIGEARCGTTNLWALLGEHPKIKNSIIKELNFFINKNKVKKGKEYYLKHFQECDNKYITGEATPQYLNQASRIAPIIYEWFPNIKLIAMLRNPVKRLYSHFYHNLKCNLQNKIDYIPQIDNINTLFKPHIAKKHNKYIGELFDRGYYCEHLKEYFEYFKRNQILIIKSEDYFSNTEKIFKQVCGFLEIDKVYNEIKNVSKTKYPHRLEKTTKNRLMSIYRPYNKNLYRLLNRDFNWEDELWNL